MGILQGRKALVCGGSEGIGLASAQALAALGAEVTLLARREAPLQAALGRLSAAHGQQHGMLVADVLALEGVLPIISGTGFDILINNSAGPAGGALLGANDDQLLDVFRQHVLGNQQLVRAIVPGMQSRQWGRIVNIGSVNGQGGQIGQVNYAAAKSGIHGFTKSLAAEGARYGVTANAIAPGYIGTEMLSTIPENVMEKIVAQIPVGRLGQPDEIARGVEFLTSDNAGFITGSTLSINGGQHMY